MGCSQAKEPIVDSEPLPRRVAGPKVLNRHQHGRGCSAEETLVYGDRRFASTPLCRNDSTLNRRANDNGLARAATHDNGLDLTVSPLARFAGGFPA